MVVKIISENVLEILFEFGEYNKPMVEEYIISYYNEYSESEDPLVYVDNKTNQDYETLFSDETSIKLRTKEIYIDDLKARLLSLSKPVLLDIEDTLVPRSKRDLYVSTHERFKTMIKITKNITRHIDNIIPRGNEYTFEKIIKDIPSIGVRTIISVTVTPNVESMKSFRLFSFDPIFINLLEIEMNRTKNNV